MFRNCDEVRACVSVQTVHVCTCRSPLSCATSAQCLDRTHILSFVGLQRHVPQPQRVCFETVPLRPHRHPLVTLLSLTHSSGHLALGAAVCVAAAQGKAPPCVRKTYTDMHTHQTVAYGKEMREKWLKFDHFQMTIMDALDLLNQVGVPVQCHSVHRAERIAPC